MIKKTCFDCNSKQKGFCRRHSIAKKCELIQDKKFAEAKVIFFQIVEKDKQKG